MSASFTRGWAFKLVMDGGCRYGYPLLLEVSCRSLAGRYSDSAFSGADTSPKLSLVSQTLLEHLNDKKTYQAVRNQIQQTNKSER
jgi:hypothetical protein